jgi:antitoxin component YwqK of YwqJK toxin-antitoxin module
MNKLLVLSLSVFLFSFEGFSQTFEMFRGDTVNKKDSQDQKEGRWLTFNKNGAFAGYSENQVVEEGFYLTNKKVGVWKKFYPNGKIKSELTFANNAPNGPAKFYYESGRLQEEGTWKDRKWVGNYHYYHENGVLFYDWEFNGEGKREGPQKYYFANGNPMYEGDWRDGKEAGLLKEFYENGSIKAEKYFSEGKLDPSNTKNFDLGNAVDRPKAPVGPIQPDPVAAKAAEKEIPKELGSIPDGQFTTYYRGDKSKIEKNGIFKNKVLIEGIQNFYDGTGKLTKSVTIKGGKSVDTKGAK